jgi:hypothetical protein
MVDYITIEDRNLLHQATKDLLSMLVERVQNERDPVNLTQMLLKRVCRAALKCPGFTPVMKDDIVFIGGIEDSVAVEAGVPPYAHEWGTFWTIGPKPGVPNDVLLVSDSFLDTESLTSSSGTLPSSVRRPKMQNPF